MASHNRMSVNFKSKQLELIVREESETRKKSLSAVIEELTVYGLIARRYEGYADADAERNYCDIHQFLYAREFPIKHVPLPRDIFDTTPQYDARVEFTFPVSTILPIDKPEEMIGLANNKLVRENIINDLMVRIRKCEDTSIMHVVIVTHATARFERHIDRFTFTIKVAYDYLHTLLNPKEGDEQKYLLDIMNIKYRGYKDVLEKVGGYPNCSAILPIREAKTRKCGGYFVSVLHQPIEFREMKKASVEKYDALLAPFIDREVISISKSSFPKVKKGREKPRIFDKLKL